MRIVAHFTVDNHAVTRYANNVVEVCRYSPTGRETVVWSHTYQHEASADMGFNVKKAEIKANA